VKTFGIIITLWTSAIGALAQNAPSTTPPKVPPLIEEFDFGAQLKALEASDGSRGAVLVTAPTPEHEKPPRDFRERTDVPLDASSREAVDLRKKWQQGTNKPIEGTDGRAVFAYGAGLPTVVCAPLRVCVIELQPGEHIAGDPHIGDSVRWHISPGSYGTGSQATAMIVLKPQVSGLDTNLLVTTDRRAYYLRLISKPDDYVARVAFEYPEEESKTLWQQHSEQHSAARDAERPAAAPSAVLAADKLDFDYTFWSRYRHLRPVRIFDDGEKTYIKMPAAMAHREAPVLVVLGADGKGEMTNYRVKDQTYIVDRLFDRANLVLGTGKKARKVEITRGTK